MLNFIAQATMPSLPPVPNSWLELLTKIGVVLAGITALLGAWAALKKASKADDRSISAQSDARVAQATADKNALAIGRTNDRIVDVAKAVPPATALVMESTAAPLRPLTRADGPLKTIIEGMGKES